MNISQQELAKRSGISLKAVRNIESGGNSTLESFVAVCRSLRVTDWIASIAPPEMSRDDFEVGDRFGIGNAQAITAELRDILKRKP